MCKLRCTFASHFYYCEFALISTTYHLLAHSYIAHSSFTLIFPLHLAYLVCTTPYTSRYYIGLAMATLRSHFSHPSSRTTSLPVNRIITTILLLTIGMSLPGLLWYIAVSLASISDVTAIWNTNAFWAYLLSVYFLHPHGAATNLHSDPREQTEARQGWWKRLEPRKLLAVALACIGVCVVVYSGTDDSNASEESIQRPVEAPSAPLAGDLLTLLASVIYAAMQVLYKKYIALPSEPTEVDAISSPLASYQPIGAADDLDGPIPEAAVSAQDEEDEITIGENVLEALPFGLYANFITSLVGLTTIVVAWPLPVFLSPPSTLQPATEAGASSLSLQIALSIIAIALSGLTWNAGYLILLGIWGPVITSVGNLLTIILMLIVESLFVEAAPTPSFTGILGCGMIAGGFAVLVWEVVGPGRRGGM